MEYASIERLLVTFELVPAGTGTLLRLTETGFRERGWEIAVLEEQYRSHVAGWTIYVPPHRRVRRTPGRGPMTARTR